MSQTDELYYKVRVTGVLKCLSPMHIGSGDAEYQSDRRQTTRPESTEKGQYATVCLGAAGVPYLPGSSLRGFLRYVAENNLDQGTAWRLFGNVEEPRPDTDGKGRSYYGALRIYNAIYRTGPTPINNGQWDSQRHTTIRQNVKLEPITLTAEERKLFSFEYVPSDSEFDFLLEAENLLATDLEAVSCLLCSWDGGVGSSIGRGKSRMQGRVQWKVGEQVIKVMRQDDVQNWLKSDKPLENFLHPLAVPLSQTVMFPPLNLPFISFRIVPDAPMLVNDPSYVGRKPKSAEEKKNANIPDLEFSRMAGGKPLIPASSLRGLLRGRARRIVATILLDSGVEDLQKAGEKAETFIRQLFGKEENRSLVWLGDAVAETAATYQHNQYFNAVDRFTGGVAEGKLYQVAARTGGKYRGMASLDMGRIETLQKEAGLSDWWKGLLLLVLRDALEGELAVGWGKARGYGAFHCILEIQGNVLDDWPGLLAYLQQKSQNAQDWIDALHNELDRIAAHD